jgi:integrase
MTVHDVKNRGDVIIILIPNTKTKHPRSSCVTEPLWLNIIRKYVSLRPSGMPLDRFFLCYKKKNKCIRQPVGIHSFGDMPSKIATFLKLENPKQYTGHCFRRSSATVLAGHGADITTIKRHGGWRSTAVAETYIEDSLKLLFRNS